MTSTDFLKLLCEGYVRSYRMFNIPERPRNMRDFRRNPIHPRWVDETHRELNFFVRLGEALGYVSRLEMRTGSKGRRWDVSWLDLDSKVEERQVVLCLECENDHRKADDVVKKLLGSEGLRACYLVGLLGWVKDDQFRRIKRMVERVFAGGPKNRSILLMAWVGDDEFHAFVAADGKLSARDGKGYVDGEKYWCVHFVGGWRKATQA